jgi:hypothetical protein
MITIDKVAEFMLDMLNHINMPQEKVAFEIEKKFGKNFISYSVSGNRTIDKRVLRQFKKLADGGVIWDRGAKAWRLVNQRLI